jgi:hypothetical protein
VVWINREGRERARPGSLLFIWNRRLVFEAGAGRHQLERDSVRSGDEAQLVRRSPPLARQPVFKDGDVLRADRADDADTALPHRGSALRLGKVHPHGDTAGFDMIFVALPAFSASTSTVRWRNSLSVTPARFFVS